MLSVVMQHHAALYWSSGASNCYHCPITAQNDNHRPIRGQELEYTGIPGHNQFDKVDTRDSSDKETSESEAQQKTGKYF